MLLALAGVTGVGKSYYKDELVKKLGFEKVKIITTREPRVGEKNGEDKIFVTKDELQALRDNGKIAYEFDLLGNTYAYTYEDIYSDKNKVVEFEYKQIFKFKEICPNSCVIYIFPTNIETAKEKTRERGLAPKVEQDRLLEIDEHYKRITTDEALRNMFDYTIYNNYDEKSEDEFINLVNDLLQKEK